MIAPLSLLGKKQSYNDFDTRISLPTAFKVQLPRQSIGKMDKVGGMTNKNQPRMTLMARIRKSKVE
jgi:hypothetical protein